MSHDTFPAGNAPVHQLGCIRSCSLQYHCSYPMLITANLAQSVDGPAGNDLCVTLSSRSHFFSYSSQDGYDVANTTARADDVTFGYEARPCNKLSTGAILLADILPALAVKSIASFLPLAKQYVGKLAWGEKLPAGYTLTFCVFFCFLLSTLP